MHSINWCLMMHTSLSRGCSFEPHWCMMHSIEPFWCLIHSIKTYWCLMHQHAFEPYWCMMCTDIDAWCMTLRYIFDAWCTALSLVDAWCTALSHINAWCTALSYFNLTLNALVHWAEQSTFELGVHDTMRMHAQAAQYGVDDGQQKMKTLLYLKKEGVLALFACFASV